MEWFDKRLAEANLLRQQYAQVRESAETVFEDLWTAVKAIVVDAAKTKVFASIATNGNSSVRVVKMRVESSSWLGPEDKELTIRLSDDKRNIEASGSAGRVKVILSLGVCPDGVVCLKYEGKELRPSEAAIKVMDPFLFPEFYTGSENP